MRVYFISPIDKHSPGLFDSFTDVFYSHGHSVASDLNDATVIFFDGHSGLFPYDWNLLNKVVEKRLPVVYFDQFDYYSGAGFSDTFYDKCNKEKGKEWERALRLFIDTNLMKVYFMRKMSKTVEYPDNFYPLELYQFPDHDFPATTKEELFNRPNDLFFIGNNATPRVNICNGLREHFKCDFFYSEQRIPHDEWLFRARQCKMFIECGGGGESGGGFNSERAYQLITISPMLRCRSEQLILNNWVDGIDCMEAGDVLGNVSSDDIQRVRYILENKDRLYEIYTAGIERMHKYFNPTYRAEYVLSTLKANNIA